MAIDIMNLLMQFLCPTSQSMQSCQSFVQAPYHQVLQPLGPLLYFFFFPTVIILLFIYILSNTVLHGTKLTQGLRLLIAIAVYIFIIINGWYPIFLWLSDIWFIIIIILGGFWYFIRGHFGKGGGEGGSMSALRSSGKQGIVEQVIQRGKAELLGEVKSLEKKVDLKLQELENIQKAVKEDPGAWRAYAAMSGEAYAIISEYKEKLMIGGVPVGGRLKEKVKKLEKILEKMDYEEKKASGGRLP